MATNNWWQAFWDGANNQSAWREESTFHYIHSQWHQFLTLDLSLEFLLHPMQKRGRNSIPDVSIFIWLFPQVIGPCIAPIFFFFPPLVLQNLGMSLPWVALLIMFQQHHLFQFFLSWVSLKILEILSNFLVAIFLIAISSSCCFRRPRDMGCCKWHLN